MTERPTILFVCVKNGGKSQMAAAIARHLGGDAVEVHSAGTKPGSSLNPESVRSVEELGASMADEHPKPVSPDLLRRANRVVVLGGEAQVQLVDGMKAIVEMWDTDEPSQRGIEGPERMRLIRDDIEGRVRALLADLGVEPEKGSTHPALTRARYGTDDRGADRFVGLWLSLTVEARQLRPGVRPARRQIDAFFAEPDIAAALEAAGSHAFEDELQDAAKRYYESSLEDPQYTSTLMGMKRLPANQIREKAAHEVALTLQLILEAEAEHAQTLFAALMRGYLAALAPHGRDELRAAIADEPAVMRAAEGLLDR